MTPTQNSDLATFALAAYDLGRAPRPTFPLRDDGRGYRGEEGWERHIEAELAKSRRRRRRGTRVIVEAEPA